MGTFREAVADLDPHEAVTGTFGTGVADWYPHEAVIGTFCEGVADLDHYGAVIGTFSKGVADWDPHEGVIGTIDEGVAVLDPQEVDTVQLALIGATRDDEAETFAGKVQSCNPLLTSPGYAGPAKVIDEGSSLRNSARNENALSKPPLPG